MAKRVKVLSVKALVEQIDEKLRRFDIEYAGLSLREKVLRLADVHFDARCLGVSVAVEEGLSKSASRERIRVYLQRHVGIVISGVELQIVSGISDYPRRIRELRVEQGYRIVTGASPDEDSGVSLKPDEYLLVADDIDQDSARRWLVANRIRRSGGGAKSRLLTFFQENLNRVVTTEELSYVAKGKKEFARRVRELRTEEGFPIATQFTGRPDLRTGEYILLSKDRVAEPHDRRIKVDVQREVYQRDNNTCRNPNCRWSMDDWTPEDPRILELHHIIGHADKGANTVENLMVLCSKCHDDVHAGRLEAADFP